jgi:hypothetical protein
VEVTRNAKGDWQFKVAVTAYDPDAAFAKAVSLAALLEAQFPFGDDDPSTKALLEATLGDEVGAKRRGKPKT